jgi:hypothetical protein
VPLVLGWVEIEGSALQLLGRFEPGTDGEVLRCGASVQVSEHRPDAAGGVPIVTIEPAP